MSSPSRRWWALALIAAAQFMVIMDTSIIGVALPRIQDDLGFTPESLSWVFNAYVVAFGGLLLLGGRLSDLFGARRVFVTGWLVLAAGSVLAGAATTVGAEIAGRAVQGVGAALIAPAALTLLMMAFGGNPAELTRALALYGAAAPAGGTAGVFLGGVLTEYASWPWVFYINIPVALAAALAAPALMPAGSRTAGSVDWFGAVTATAGLGGLVYAVVRAPQAGWAAASTWLLLAASVALLVVFAISQAVRRAPLMRLSLLRTPNLGAANLVQLLLGAAWIPMWFFLNLYLQQVLEYTAFPSGAALLPMTALIMAGMIAVAPKVIARFGPKATTIAGLVLLAGGIGWLAFIRPDGAYATDVLPASLVAAAGMSLAFIPSLGTAISSAPPADGGLASGLVNTSYQIGSALGLAAMTAVAAAFTGQADGKAALTDGFSAALTGAAVVAAAGAVIAAVALRRPAPAPEPAAAPTPELAHR